MEQTTDRVREKLRRPHPHQIEGLSRAQKVALLSSKRKAAFFDSLTPEQLDGLYYDWNFWGRPAQHLPDGDWWTIALWTTGRGWGKDRAASEIIRRWSNEYPIMHLVARSAADARDVMIEGDAGILRVHPPDQRPKYEPTKRRLTWPNGCVALVFSADEPDQLRGPQAACGWADEIAHWPHVRQTFDNLMFGLRLGSRPRLIITTTPKPTIFMRELIAREGKDVIVVRGSLYENAPNLAPSFVSETVGRYEGTRLGRQEIYGELLEDVEGALWTPELIERAHDDIPDPLPPMRRVVVGVDPSWGRGATNDECGIVVAGIDHRNMVWILADYSCRAAPNVWGKKVKDAYDQYQADRIVAEVNFGAETVKNVLATVDPRLHFKEVRASRGKAQRAEPVVALYEQKRVKHATIFTDLENELLTWVPGESDWSPGRLDGLTWAATELAVSHSYTQARIVTAPDRRIAIPRQALDQARRTPAEQASPFLRLDKGRRRTRLHIV